MPEWLSAEGLPDVLPASAAVVAAADSERLPAIGRYLYRPDIRRREAHNQVDRYPPFSAAEARTFWQEQAQQLSLVPFVSPKALEPAHADGRSWMSHQCMLRVVANFIIAR